MNKSGFWACLAGGAVLLVFLAGFFHADKSFESADAPVARLAASQKPMPAACPAPLEPPGGNRGLLALTNSPSYKRAGDLSLRVEDCTKAGMLRAWSIAQSMGRRLAAWVRRLDKPCCRRNSEVVSSQLGMT